MHTGFKFLFYFFLLIFIIIVIFFSTQEYCQKCEKKKKKKKKKNNKNNNSDKNRRFLLALNLLSLSKSFLLRLYVPVNIFFSHDGTEPTLPGLNQLERS